MQIASQLLHLKYSFVIVLKKELVLELQREHFIINF